MDSIEVLSYERLGRVKDYGSLRTADFPPTGRGGQFFAEVEAIVAELSDQATAQKESDGGALVSSATKARLRASIREDLRVLTGTVRVITADNPDLKKKFRLPKSGDVNLLSAARAFLRDAEPFAAQFPNHEITAEFLAKFKSDIAAFGAAMIERNQSRESRVRATARLRTLLSRGNELVKKLDVIVKNKYRNDAPNLLAWETAKHLEQSKRRSRTKAKTDQAPAVPSKDKPSGVPTPG